MAQFAMGRLFQQGASRQSVTFSQIRNFASKSAIPTFSPTASTELNQALEHWRQDLFIPFGLPKRQRMSMFKEKHARRLEDEPITVKISETEEYTLRPLKLSELPKSKEAINVFRLMEAANDYKNLVPFLNGLWNAQMTISPARWQYLIRKTGSAGRLSLIIECARQEKHTGLSLQDNDIAERLFFEFHRMAHDAGFKGEQVNKALRMAKQAVDIMDTYAPSPATNPKYQPYVIGTLLELSAARALEEAGGKDKNNEVLNYVRKLIACWHLGDFAPIPMAQFDAELVNQRFIESVAVCTGLQLSLSIHGLAVDKALHSTVKSRLSEVKNAITAQLKQIPQGSVHKVLSAEFAKAALKQK
ncbi:hypothetical protein N7520_000221 [Penicillium odoratum]|uniref:uncharacterized protein n=1 Tax=Penicillium odoratum TaxID=1167516 RepID=UPI0025499308|nr:uncharacterized protein N7520_000221 [Penicillium odoratum]KAJ5776975.1 hypothetical protein N7520_000221 [Penicillium odoratum]